MLKETSNYSWFEYIFKLLSEADMAYNTTVFFVFLTSFIGLYLLLPTARSKRNWVLLGSILFYIWSGIGAFIIVVGTAIIVYVISRIIEKIYADYDLKKEGLSRKEQRTLFVAYKKKAQKYMWVALAVLISLWAGVKIGKLLDYNTVESLYDMSIGLGIIVPLGISYYTLSAVGYTLDVFWRKTKPEHNFLNLFAAMIYFPHIMQGPISKYSGLIEQMKNLPKINYNRVCFGLQLMLWGYIKKMVVADRLVLYTDTIFSNPASYAGVEILIAVVLCVIQLYADFSGCMDIVRGVSQVIGIELEQNFRQPFFAKSAQEFWARWHMTLGGWTKDYIYIPIALNPKMMKRIRKMQEDGHAWRASFLRAFCPLIAVWIFTGLWHGTGWDYIAWGLYWCVIMTLAKELQPIGDKIIQRLSIKTESIGYQLWKMIRTCGFFAVGRMITVTGVLTGGLYLVKRMLIEFRLWTLFDGTLYTHGLEQKDFYVALAGIGVMLAVDILHERGVAIRDGVADQMLLVRWLIYYIGIIGFVVFGMYGPGFDAASFVYGAF